MQSQPTDTTNWSIEQLRKDWRYRCFEGFTGSSAILFILILVLLSIYQPTVLAVFLIVYSFFIVLKSALHTIYTFYTFNNIYRWEKLDWQKLLGLMETDSTQALKLMNDYKQQYPDKLNWDNEWNGITKEYQTNIGTNLQSPNQLFQIIFVPIYNENIQVLTQSIKRIYDCGYDLSRIWVVIARESRAGKDFNDNMEAQLRELDWIKVFDMDNLETSTFGDWQQKVSDLDFGNQILKQVQDDKSTKDDNLINSKKNNQTKKPVLTVLLASHPADMLGEIKGKGSNLDWAGRQVSQLANDYNLDQDTTIITVLDCDSRPGKNFFQILAFRFCTNFNRHNVGFQPIPVFTNNYFDSTLLSSLVATGTTLWNFVQTSIPEEIHHFANYSVSLKLLRQTNFWVKDLVSEDSLFFDKNFCELNGQYQSVPTFAYFESDVVESDTFGEALFNQYKQLRRWAYGGVEGFSYLANRLYLQPKGKQLDSRKKLMIMYNEWVGHFFWSTMPFVFCFVMFLPSIFNTGFNNTVVASNLSFFSQAFSLISYGFLITNGFVILHFIKTRLQHRNQELNWHNYLDIIIQVMVSPLLFAIWFLPPIEAQIRGIFGWYLGFWVTPKK